MEDLLQRYWKNRLSGNSDRKDDMKYMTNEKPLVSIIMPVYNTGKYLDKSIGSVIQQIYENWELIVVDDGSTDNSISIIQSFAQKDQRIQLYINESDQHGPGIARNIGLDHLRGKYTYFIDSDDWIEKELLVDTVTKAEETGADLVPFGFIIEEENRQIRKPLKPAGNYEYDDFKEIANGILRGTWGHVTELIKSELLASIRQNQYKSGEDICFQMDVLCKTRKVCGIDKEYYHYCIRKDSITFTHNSNDQFVENAVTLWNKEKQFLEYVGLTSDDQAMKCSAIERYTSCIYWICKRKGSFDIQRKIREVEYIGNAMHIERYKEGYDTKPFILFKRVLKQAIIHGYEKEILFMGTLFFKIMSR